MSPLEGKRIVDCSRYAPGSYCSLVCAALGAEVIKVEAPSGGDPLRRLDPEAFERLNRGKKSLVVDLKSAAGTERMRRLLSTADVFIESFRPGVMKRLRLDYGTVRESAPEIVYVSISGYGQSGPASERAGHDVNYMAVAGVLDGAGKPLPLQVADFAAGGLYAVVAVLAALMEGRGRYIDLAMHEGLLALSMLAGGAAGDVLSGRYPNYTLYRTRDGGMISVGALEPKFWRAFCDGIDRPDLAERWHDPTIRDEVAELVSQRTAHEWDSIFRGKDACVEPVCAPDDAPANPQARHRGFSASRFQVPFGLGAEARTLSAAPALGEHTEEILAALG